MSEYKTWKFESDAMELLQEAEREVVRRHYGEVLALIDASYDYQPEVRARAVELHNGSLSKLITSIEVEDVQTVPRREPDQQVFRRFTLRPLFKAVVRCWDSPLFPAILGVWLYVILFVTVAVIKLLGL